MLQARYAPYRLYFKEPSGTSRGVLTYKDTYFVQMNMQTIKHAIYGEENNAG